MTRVSRLGLHRRLAARRPPWSRRPTRVGFRSWMPEAATTSPRSSTAEHDRDRYRRKGPDRTTRMLLDMIRPYRVGGSTVLDVGGGIGGIDSELLWAGAGHAVPADPAAAHLDVA